MKKILILSVLTLVALCLLASCDSSTNPPSNEGAGDAHVHIHEFGEWDVTEKPTCSEKGTKVRYCSCGEGQTEVIDKLDHSFADGVCTACGEIHPDYCSKGLEYTLNEGDESYSVTGIGTCTDTDIFIPNTYEGLPVTSIDSYAFRECTGLKSVVIGGSVTSIGYNAFEGCTGLTSIEIPDSVTSIGYAAFHVCTGLTSITVDEDNTSYQSIDGNLYSKDGKTFIQYAIGKKNTSFTIPDSVTSIGNGAFYNCTGLASIVIPDSVTRISWNAFSGCTGLTSIVIPDSVTSIFSHAFYRCTGLTSIVIPDSVTSISADAFRDCTGLTSVVIPDSVTSIDDHTFYGCTSLTSIVIPDSVTSIGYGAFHKCTGLTSIVIPDSVTSIGDFAFAGCTSLTSIVIGDSVTRIGYDAFAGCTGLTDVYYTGTEAEWANVSINFFGNYYLTGATIHYNYVPAN